jgi:predicted extracellular nuclease
MSGDEFSVATFNLFNLNEPRAGMYGSEGWTEEQYDRKIDWTANILRTIDADVVGFQELWNRQSLENVLDNPKDPEHPENGKLKDDYDPLTPDSASGGRIFCAAIVRKELLVGEPEWISDFPEKFVLKSSGDDPQTPSIEVAITGFSRPILHFQIKPHSNEEDTIDVYVCHLKSKKTTVIRNEDWYEADIAVYKNMHETNLGSALSTIRRTAESAALRFYLTDRMKKTAESDQRKKHKYSPVIILGDINDNTYSNTANILTEQPRYLSGDSLGGGDNDLYSTQTLQEYRDTRDVFYTHIYNDMKESLDQIFVSQELYDHSRYRVWLFQKLVVYNDHLYSDDHKVDGTSDHGIIKATFKYKPKK